MKVNLGRSVDLEEHEYQGKYMSSGGLAYVLIQKSTNEQTETIVFSVKSVMQSAFKN
jgi:hypothetical protein